VILTSGGDEQAAVAAIKAGAMDYVVKSAHSLADMPHVVRRTLRQWGNLVERRRVERRLHLLSSAIEQSSEGMAVANPEGNLLFVNEAFAAMHGFSRDELLGRHLSVVHTPSQMPAVNAALRQIRETGDFSGEMWHARRDGSVFPSLMHNSLLRDEAGAPVGILGTLRDISHRKRAEEELQKAHDELEHRVAERTAELAAANAALETEIADRRQAEESLVKSEIQFRKLFENLPDFVIVVARDASIQFANRATDRVTPEELAGTIGFSYVSPEHQSLCRAALDLAIESGEVQTVRTSTKYGEWWDCRIVPLLEEAATPRAMVICTDIGAHKKARETVEKERRLLRQLLDLQERERQLIAYEIHDGFAQQLTGAFFQFQGYLSQQERDPEEARKTFELGLGSLEESIREARRLISGLRPPILDEAGIVAAIDYLICEATERDGLDVEFFRDVSFHRLAPPLEATIFRVVQESLTNTRRHSQCKRARVSLTSREGRLLVETEDWGVGFEPDTVDESHFGLRGIRERARLFGGSATIDAVPGRGTRIAVELPMLESPPSAEGPSLD
jgi:PAS domain S-box-containing protein